MILNKFKRGDDITQMRKRRERLQTDLDKATRALEAAHSERIRLLVESDADADPDALSRVDATCREHSDRIAALTDAVAELARRIADRESSVTAEAEKSERKRVSQLLEKRASVIETAAVSLQDAMDALVERAIAVEKVMLENAPGRPDGDFMGPHYHLAEALQAGLRYKLHDRFARLGLFGTHAPGIMVTGVLAAPAELNSLSAIVASTVNPMRELAQSVNDGKAPPIAPAAFVDIPPAWEDMRFSDVEIVLDRPVAYRDARGEQQRTIAGGTTVPKPVAEAAKKVGVGFDRGQPEAESIIRDMLNNPGRRWGGTTAAPERSNSAYRDAEPVKLDVDLSLINERAREAAIAEGRAS